MAFITKGEQVCGRISIVINEIMQNPSSVPDYDGEWFELYNYGEDTVDISGWVFKDDDDTFLFQIENYSINNFITFNIQ